MQIEWNKVTWYSKLFALVIFVALPFIAFYFGITYGEAVQLIRQNDISQNGNISAGTSGDEYYGNVSEWQAEKSTAGGFMLAYPIDFDTQESYSTSPAIDWRVNANGTTGTKYFMLVIPRAYDPQSNLIDVTFTVGASANAAAIQNCLTPNLNEGTGDTTTAIINGIQFFVSKSNDAGAGNYYKTTSYRAIHGGKCYAIEYVIHSSQMMNYPAKYHLHLFDEARLSNLLQRMIGTFHFTSAM